MNHAMMGNLQRPAFDVVVHTPVRDDGLVIGETVAWRCWRVMHGYLRSVAMDSIWVPGELMDGKILSDHGQADSGGIHAFKTMKEALRYGLPAASQNTPMAIGRVKLHGEIIEHEKGYRAEFARVSHIEDVIGLPMAEREPMIAAIRARYNCGAGR